MVASLTTAIASTTTLTATVSSTQTIQLTTSRDFALQTKQLTATIADLRESKTEFGHADWYGSLRLCKT